MSEDEPIESSEQEAKSITAAEVKDIVAAYGGRKQFQRAADQVAETLGINLSDEEYKRAVDQAMGGVYGTLETKPSNPKDAAATDRLDMTLFPDTAIAYGALGFAEGHIKYGAYNWRVAGVSASVYYAAAKRHLSKWYNGEWEDPNTGVPHLANALDCIAIIIDAYEVGKLNDDRPPRHPDPDRLFEHMRKKVRILQDTFGNGGPGRYTELGK